MKAIFHVEKDINMNKSIWSKEEDRLLVSHVQTQNRRTWKKIAQQLSNKTPYQCSLRYRSINPNISKGAWKSEEDSKILEGIRLYGKKWNMIAITLPTRNAKQIRDRYINYLDPHIKQGNFTVDEDILIMDLHVRYGNKWAKIHKYLPNRSCDMIKNRYNSSISRNKKLLSVLKSLSYETVSIFILL
jgi:myb proto-oncogene protein